MAVSIENTGATAVTSVITNYEGQTFTTVEAFNISTLSLSLNRRGDWVGAQVDIYAVDGAHKPTGSSLCTATVDSTGITNFGYPIVVFQFTTNPQLSAATEYAFVLKAVGASNTMFRVAYLQVGYTAAAYAGGSRVTSTDAGASWTVESNDLWFKVAGYTLVTPYQGEGVGASVSAATATLAVTKAMAGTCASASTAAAGNTLVGFVTETGSASGVSAATATVLVARVLAGTGASVSAVTTAVVINGVYHVTGSCASISAATCAALIKATDGGRIVRMIDFVYSASVAYAVEFGHLYARFYYGGAPLLSGGNHVEVVTPYDEDDLYAIQYHQVGDVMWLVHPSYPPMKLSRVSATSFTLAEIEFEKGPFLKRNDLDATKDDSITLVTDVIDEGLTGTMRASAATFTSGHEGALFSLTHPRANRSTNGVKTPGTTGVVGIPIEVYGNYTFSITSSGWAGTVKLQKSLDSGATWQDVYAFNNGKKATHEGNEASENIQYRLNVTANTSTAGHDISASLVEKTSATSGKLKDNNIGVIGYPIRIKGDYTFDTHGTWAGTIVLERNENNGGWETFRSYNGDKDRNIQLSFIESMDNVFYRMNLTQHTSGTISCALAATSPTVTGVVRVDTVVSTTVAHVTVLSPIGQPTETTRWAEGSWSEQNGYPQAIGFFDDRIWYAGTSANIPTVWASVTDDYENFEAGEKDDDSFSLSIMDTNSIRWLESVRSGIAVGTASAEWVIASNKLDMAITPTNWTVRKQSTCGSKSIMPIRCNASVLFVDYVGRKVREFAYAYDQDRYVAADLTALAEHITDGGGIVNWAFQRNPDPIVWCVLADGQLVCLTYDREQNVVAWAKQPIDGDVQSVCVLPGETEDEIWLSVLRVIGGREKIYIETMAARDYGPVEDAWFVDCGIAYSGVPATSITGLDHLEGETVSVLGDGKALTDCVVSGGAITVSTPVSKAQIGLPFTSVVRPMRMDPRTSGGDSLGSIRRFAEVSASFIDTAGAKYGKDETVLFDVPFPTDDLYTGDVVLSHDGGWDTQSEFVLSQSKPLPCVLRSLVFRMDVTGR